MAKKSLYVYPCEDSFDCFEFLSGWESMSFAEFCETVCGSCPYCMYLDIPYSEVALKK